MNNIQATIFYIIWFCLALYFGFKYKKRKQSFILGFITGAMILPCIAFFINAIFGNSSSDNKSFFFFH